MPGVTAVHRTFKESLNQHFLLLLLILYSADKRSNQCSSGKFCGHFYPSASLQQGNEKISLEKWFFYLFTRLKSVVNVAAFKSDEAMF